MEKPIPKRRLGRTGVEVSILGLGGEGVLRTVGREQEADTLINTAIDLGINYMESARAYAGSEAYYGLALREEGRRSSSRASRTRGTKRARLPTSKRPSRT